jgi:hypothetical protein
VIVKFKGNVTKDQAANLAKRNRLEMLRSIPYAGNAYQYRLANHCLQIARSLRAAGQNRLG